ncbi:hypothetical protein PoB_005742900 [Plakobranchus ocellatus]|uniref:Uncharacterized protein n=1 Tax=Plakobranchus ocellatus TaxID=259542 RepID=A0AAV4CIF1_9GAST|nr:hypothetical protein PoB_005742900 [Plakobranchus ocellatus]
MKSLVPIEEKLSHVGLCLPGSLRSFYRWRAVYTKTPISRSSKPLIGQSFVFSDPLPGEPAGVQEGVRVQPEGDERHEPDVRVQELSQAAASLPLPRHRHKITVIFPDISAPPTPHAQFFLTDMYGIFVFFRRPK